jgi:hypothetical protein
MITTLVQLILVTLFLDASTNLTYTVMMEMTPLRIIVIMPLDVYTAQSDKEKVLKDRPIK